ncbi:hypothetical protein O181_058261 [Austropuccinia psidii MF-1]|uniref:Uncharacterized protein n=1 Tax=Austropuccinia psidii MF-1 TaxID=1389203 RepID=A0A9Q3HUP5_9BASI|nr:hypothetical protein [Austropuccinia psidii MF-1]
MDRDSGNFKLTHHVEFIPTTFPAKVLENSETDLQSFCIDDEESLPIPQIIENDETNTIEENIFPMSPDGSDNSFNSACLQVQLETTMTEINLPKHKGYEWVPEKDISAPNEIVGDIDPSPKTYEQAISVPDGEEWAEAVKTELETWSDIRCGSQLHPQLKKTPINYMGIQEKNQSRWTLEQIQGPPLHTRVQ